MRRVREGFAALRTAALATTLILAGGWAMSAEAQVAPTGEPVGAEWLPTRAGTEIKNIATASFTDINGNLYDTVSDSVTVVVDSVPLWTVALIGQDSVIVTGGEEYTYYFQLTNLSNFTDWPDISDPLDGTDNVELVSYCFEHYNADGTVKPGGPYCYDTFGELQDALEALDVDIHEYIVLAVTVTVKEDQGGFSDDITVEVDSGTNPTGEPDSATVTLYIGEVAVDAEYDEVSQLPSGGTDPYTATFTVTNDQDRTVTYDLTSAFEGANDAGLTILRIELCSDPGTAITDITILAGEDAEVCIVYTVADNAAGTTGTLQLTATDSEYDTITASDTTTVTIIRPSLTITKKAYRDLDAAIDETEEITDLGLVIPGEFFWYKITVSNVGSADAADVQIVDKLPVYLAGNTFPLNYLTSLGDDAADWDITTNAVVADGLVVTADLQPALSYTAPDNTRYILIRVQVR